MPKEGFSVLGMLLGDEPGPLERILHGLRGEDEGSWGEKCIVSLLENRVDQVRILQNVYVPLSEGTTELDVVMLGRNAIYLFESKAYGGKIYGDPEQLYWTQYLNGKKSRFYNPVRQNENHRRNLAAALKISSENIFSFVVFENRADITHVSPLRGNGFVICCRKNLMKELKALLQKKPVFEEKEVVLIYEKLAQWSNARPEVKQRHVQQVQERTQGKRCPFCGEQLVERKGKYGVFIGCSGYPKCRYIREKL